MELYQKYRIKSAMIIYALEEALGNYVIQNEEQISSISEGSKKEIIEREESKGRSIDNSNTTLLVESSYLDEVFNFAIDITTGTSFETHMRNLKSYAYLLTIFDIRNSISHPNRPFPQCYWFRAAAIASDPLVDQLGLSTVRQALSSAIAENLNPPPDEWFSNVIWGIPNTLPNMFDHDITGLVGRDKEFKNLKSVLSNLRNNLIAVVAPGGIGKTALILQFLKDLSVEPKWNEKIDAIIFCTLKNERLTTDGIQKIEAINGLGQIKEALLNDLQKIYTDVEFDSFEEACERLENQKVLLCIDNLETLLVKSQSEFINFNQLLPLTWRVLVTSRISIDSAITVPLEPLVKRHAENLSRSYFKKRGINNFEHSQIEKIAKSSNNNPLAIRLTIDAYLKGGDIPTSIEKTQKDIALFSYKNFIELLTDESVSILEAIYVTGSTSKNDLTNLLGFSNESISESINELSKTTLIIRTINEIGSDTYRLSESIRDLLLINPKNIEIRQKISEKVRQRKVKILEQAQVSEKLNISRFDERYIESGTNENIHELILDLNKFLRKPFSKRNHKELVKLKQRFSDSFTYNPNDPQLTFHYSRVLKNLRDKTSELTFLEKALSVKPDDARIKFAIGLNQFYSSEYEKASKIFQELISYGYSDPEKTDERFSFSMVKLFFQSLLHLGDFDNIFKLTENWEKEKYWSILFGTYRASSLKRSIELETKNHKIIEETFTAAINIYSKIFSEKEYSAVACVEANKLIEQLDFKFHQVKSITITFKKQALDFISTHFFEIVQRLKNVDLESYETQKLLRNFYNLDIEDNPIRNVKWYSPTRKIIYDREHIEELKREGYTIVEVYYIPQIQDGASSYLFARGKDKQEYYLQVSNFNGGWNRWGYITLNSKLAIQYNSSKGRNKSLAATDIMEIDKFEIW